MEDCPKLVLKKLCCTCLSQDRQLKQLCRLTEGINNLYLLLSYDSEAYREGFFKDTANWFICWECWAIMRRISQFRTQACVAQRQLSDILDGRTDLKHFKTCLSRLSCAHKAVYDNIVQGTDVADNFIDCGLDVKTESDEDVPLSELHSNYIADDKQYSDNETLLQEVNKEKNLDIQPVYKKRKKSTKIKKKKESKIVKKTSSKLRKDKAYFITTEMSDEEMLESRKGRKMAAIYADAKYKCESCIKGFKCQIALNEHNIELHSEKEKHTKCDICEVYIDELLLTEHCSTHRLKHQCRSCDVIAYSLEDIMRHQTSHFVSKTDRKSARVLNPGSKPRRNRVMADKRTPYGYKCPECDKYFENKNIRWKHVQRLHREGYKCSTCDKRFAFKNNLARHERQHLGPLPRQPCPHCHKQVRIDLLTAHLRIHSARERPQCVECDKRFVSRASYENHLKYASRHAQRNVHKYKCDACDKGYRSRGELRDHYNYQHMGKTQHKCPICEKALASPRCITRHVRRAHHGLKEQARDKVCQQCGKTFRDKKTLREHEFIHTGERPLSCEVCGCTFRQSASLYTHRKRVHRLHAPRKNVTLLQTDT